MIAGFRDDFRFLSNFYNAPVTYNGVTYIKWDITDGAEDMTKKEIKKILTTLPKSVDIDKKELDKYDIQEDSDLDEIIDATGNYLSDTYGFCHYSFDIVDDSASTSTSE